MSRGHLALGFAALAAVLLAVLLAGRLGSTYSTFTDTSAASGSVQAASNFVPAQCQGLAGTLANYNVIKGTAGNDTLNGSNDSGVKDLIFGFGGDDTINGRNGADCIVGGNGNDTISGGNGNDVLLGGNANDTLNGDNGLDTLDGGDGTDSCNGGAGPDSATNCESTTSVP